MATTAPTLIEIPIAKLVPATDNPRRNLGDLTGLAATIRGSGIIEPLVVVDGTKPGTYLIVAGHRRHAAAKKLRLKTVPCVVHQDLDDSARREAMAIENLQRYDLTPLEEAAAFQQLIDLDITPKWTQKRIAERVGCQQPHVSKRLALLKLPPDARAALDRGDITLEDAAELAKHDADPTVITEALKSPRNISWALERAVSARDRAKARAELEAKLHEKGVPTVDLVDYGATYLIIGNGYNQLDVDKRAHVKEPCHAIAVGFRYGSNKPTAVHVCTEPKRHNAKGPSGLKKPVADKAVTATRSGESKAAKARREQEAAERDARRDTLTALVEMKPQRQVIIDEVLRRFLDIGERCEVEQRLACQFLGLTITTKGQYDSDAEDLLKAYIDSATGAKLDRAVLAFLFADGEYEHSWRVRTDEHLAFVKGYAPDGAVIPGVLADDEKGTVHDPDAPTTAKGVIDAQLERDAAFVETNDLQPGDEVNDDGTITRAADTDAGEQTTVDDHAGTIPIGRGASTHQYVDNGKKDECGMCGRRRAAHVSAAAPDPTPDNAAETSKRNGRKRTPRATATTSS